MAVRIILPICKNCSDGVGSDITKSRKRKLRCLFELTVCDDDPLPQLSYSSLDAPPTTTAELNFLDACDLAQYVCLSHVPRFKNGGGLYAAGFGDMG